MRASEFLTELRIRLLDYIQKIVPKWPEYVVWDWLYKNNARFGSVAPNLQARILDTIKDAGLSPDTQWQLVPNFKFTMDMWEPRTLKYLKLRAGGQPHPEIPSTLNPDTKDAQRHATQATLSQQQGGVSQEPVILSLTSQGVELLEGWHRTIQHIARYPDGYVGPAWVARSTL
jgi:hypothetical protein